MEISRDEPVDDFEDFILPKSTNAELQHVNQSNVMPAALERELFDFESEPRISPKTNIIEFWDHIKIKYENLYRLAVVIMAIPSSQTTVERAFSTLSFILQPLRNRLSNDTLANILLIKTNEGLLDDLICENIIIL